MAQTGYTPIKLYLSTTPAAVPTAANLEPGELALNNADGKLFYEDSAGVVQVIATKAGASGTVTSVGGTGTVNGITLTGTVTSSGNLTLGGALTGVNLATQVTGTLPAANGGTGQSSYAVGDLVFASTTTALSKLADVATGNALISGGVGVAPAYGKIGLTTHVSGTLPATNGGTGQSSYAVGDLVFASTTTALSKLADVATGNALISGGVGVAPSYGKIGLTTHVTDTLPVANGGTGITSFGTGVATFLGTPTSANLAAAVTNETGSGALVFGTAPTISAPIINDGYTEEIFAVSGTTPALSPANGSIQTWTLSGNSTPTQGTWNNGQSITLMIDDGSAFTVTWTSLAVTWKTDGGNAPTLNTTGYTVITLWEVGSVIYGARVGNA